MVYITKYFTNNIQRNANVYFAMSDEDEQSKNTGGS